MRILKNKWFQRFAKKENLTDASLRAAVVRATSGGVDANLGAGVIKQRVARPGEGKAKGYRTIIFFRQGALAIFVYGFPKSKKSNLTHSEENAFKEAAKHLLSLPETSIARLVENGELIEVTENEQEVSQ